MDDPASEIEKSLAIPCPCVNTWDMGAPIRGGWLAAAADAGNDDLRGPRGERERGVPQSGHFPVPISAEDAALLARLRVNDDMALHTLMVQYTADVARIAYHYLKQEDLAYDVAQDVFIAVWERRQLLDDRTPIVHYLRRAARNRALNVLRQHASQARTVERAAGDPTAPRHAANAGPVELRAAEVDATVRAMAFKMTPRVREVLLLYYERELEPGEIATLLGVAPRTVYGQLRTALRMLAAALASHEDVG